MQPHAHLGLPCPHTTALELLPGLGTDWDLLCVLLFQRSARFPTLALRSSPGFMAHGWMEILLKELRKAANRSRTASSSDACEVRFFGRKRPSNIRRAFGLGPSCTRKIKAQGSSLSTSASDTPGRCRGAHTRRTSNARSLGWRCLLDALVRHVPLLMYLNLASVGTNWLALPGKCSYSCCLGHDQACLFRVLFFVLFYFFFAAGGCTFTAVRDTTLVAAFSDIDGAGLQQGYL